MLEWGVRGVLKVNIGDSTREENMNISTTNRRVVEAEHG